MKVSLKFRKIRHITLFILLVLLFFLNACDQATKSSTEATQDYYCSYNIIVEVQNSEDQIQAEYVPCHSHGTESDYQFTASGFCMIYDLVENLENIPSIEQENDMDLIMDSGVNISSISVYNSDATLLEIWDSWEERSTLESGQYFIRLSVDNKEDHCVVSGHSIFVINVD